VEAGGGGTGERLKEAEHVHEVTSATFQTRGDGSITRQSTAANTDPLVAGHLWDMHRQSMASRSQFGQSSAQTATAQALRNKKKEYEAISALEQSCTELIATLEEMATDLNTTAEATIGTIRSSDSPPNVADRRFGRLIAIGKAMEHWTEMFQILSISRALRLAKTLLRLYAEPISSQLRR